MEHKIKVHLEGFDDPLVGLIRLEGDKARIESLFGTERKGSVRAEGTTLVVNHEEQYSIKGEEEGFDDPLVGYTVAFDDPLVGKRLEEVYREKREVLVSVSPDGSELKIS